MSMFDLTGGGGGAGDAGGGIGGSTGAADNRLIQSDGAGGETVQPTNISVVGTDDTLIVDGLLVYPGANLSDDEKVQVSESFLFASDVVFRYYNNPDISSGSADLGFVRDAAGIWRFTNGSTGQGAVRCTRPVVALSGGGPVTAARTRSAFTNAGASGSTDFELPAAAEGLEYIFAVHAAHALNVIAAGADLIRVGSSVSSAGGQATENTVGASLHLTCTAGGVWTGISSGAWNLT